MGASQWDIFRRIIFPATLPSIVVGSAVGMGITWEVVVAAEMISGGGGRVHGSPIRSVSLVTSSISPFRNTRSSASCWEISIRT